MSLQTSKTFFSENKIQVCVKSQLRKPLKIKNNIKQGDFLSRKLFNIIMDKLIKKVRLIQGYRLGDMEAKILCNAEVAILLADNQEKLWKLLYTFNRIAKYYNIMILLVKTKYITTWKHFLRCKLEMDGQIIKKKMRIIWFGQ